MRRFALVSTYIGVKNLVLGSAFDTLSESALSQEYRQKMIANRSEESEKGVERRWIQYEINSARK